MPVFAGGSSDDQAMMAFFGKQPVNRGYSYLLAARFKRQLGERLEQGPPRVEQSASATDTLKRVGGWPITLRESYHCRDGMALGQDPPRLLPRIPRHVTHRLALVPVSKPPPYWR